MKPGMLATVILFSICASAQSTTGNKEVHGVYDSAYKLYVDLHQTPELSSHETQTAANMAGRLRALGYDVTEHVGGTGIVAILKNGTGPTVMLRTELEALPVEEKTGLAYASKVRTKDDAGHDVAVMHACGHDLHMAALYGTAAIMAKDKQSWHGTLMLIGQPAEETITGAKKMIDDGVSGDFPSRMLAFRCTRAICCRRGRWVSARGSDMRMPIRCGLQFSEKAGMVPLLKARLIRS